MTLCIAWKQNENIYFASDSRLSGPNGEVGSDNATKIFKIDVKIVGTSPEETLIFQSNYGICIAGSYINGSLLADTLSEVLSSIQATPMSDYSLDNLANISFYIYKEVSTQLMELNRGAGLSKVLLTGVCPISKEYKVYKFDYNPIIANQKIEFVKSEIDIEKELPIFLGDEKPKSKAEDLLSNFNNQYGYFHLLKDIIKDSDFETVGGGIQSGYFNQGEFRLNGIIEYEMEEDDYGYYHPSNKFLFRGLSFDFDNPEIRQGDINILKSFFDPFQKERKYVYEESNRLNDDKINNM